MNFFNKMRVATRLALGFGVLLAAMVVISALSIVQLNSIGSKVDDLANNRMVKVQKFNELKGNFQAIARISRSVALIEDPQRAKVEADKIPPLQERNSKLLAEIDPMIAIPRGVELMKTIQRTRGPYNQAIGEALRLGVTGDPNDAKQATDLLLGEVARQQDIIFRRLTNRWPCRTSRPRLAPRKPQRPSPSRNASSLSFSSLLASSAPSWRWPSLAA